MKKLFAFLALLLAPAFALSAVDDAVVRIPSHGASATIIHTESNKTLLLGCAHAYQGQARKKPMTVDVPRGNGPPNVKATIELLAIDYDVDLSLVEIGYGPMLDVAPVAPAGHTPSANLLSVGYDEMRDRATKAPATLLGTNRNTAFTREKPWHGRSGGALLDMDKGFLIGVVQGYEIGGHQRGMYVSHAAILAFVAKHRPERRACPCPGGCPCPQCPGKACPVPDGCPGGICPRQCPGGVCPR